MPNTRTIERKWIENFKKCPLIDKETGTFKSQYANHFFYGKQDDTYPSDYPHDFIKFYGTYGNIDRDTAI